MARLPVAAGTRADQRLRPGPHLRTGLGNAAQDTHGPGRSTVRRHIAPGHPDATFAGYVIWIGIAEESAIGARLWPQDVAFLGDNDNTLLGYPLPGANGSLAPGSRRLGWAWYDSSRNGLLRSGGSVTGSVARHSLMPAGIPNATFRELAAEARELFPSP
ncbi:FAD binding domain-containing protein [Arthrobacter sp. 131MFCol6.1]|uniref:FAD binding domain-containing protein n=1 Tax=Arthrobacter sp. 131MFCol6.1 TaxID=1157944 RepID=UPI00035E52A2|nr:hypothetical protein [Arthrobacter sp. 131MFCol6.1]